MSGLIVYVNPAAGKGRAVQIFTDLCKHESRLAEATVLGAEGPEEACERVRRLVEDGADRIVVIGGDGTVQLMADVLLENDLAAQAAIGFVPAGTGSDLARNLGIPVRPLAAIVRALEATPRTIDALLVTTDDGRRRHVVNVASAGISGLVDELTSDMEVKGSTGYLRATLKALGRYQAVDCRVEVDGEEWFEGPLFLLAVANSPSFGDGMKIAPHAILDDGLADIVLVRDISKWHLPLRLPQIYLGTHLSSRFVQWKRGRQVRIEPLAPMPPFDLDGELFPSSAATIQLLPGALRVLA